MFASKSNLYNQLITAASSSLIEQQLAACVMKSGRMITQPCVNHQRNTCRGNYIGSLHAEASAILNYCGKSLSYDKKKGWCFLRPRKKVKEPKIRLDGSSSK